MKLIVSVFLIALIVALVPFPLFYKLVVAVILCIMILDLKIYKKAFTRIAGSIVKE
jgi:uncharacterized protein (DUF697 family)